MKRTASRRPFARAASAGLLSFSLLAAAPLGTPQAVIAGWPRMPRAIAEDMIQKYGLPHRYDAGALFWTNNGPWRRTVVRRAPAPLRPSLPNEDFLEQTIRYSVPADEVGYLQRFDGRLSVDVARGELTSRAQSEPLNFLALNLADEILRGNRTVESARDFYQRTARLAQAGKSSPYMRGFLFQGHPFMDQIFYP